MQRKNKIVHLPKVHNAMGASHNAYIKAMLGQVHTQRPNDMVETLIEERKKQLIKEKHVQKNKV
tara:strand:+ start:1753 stop:1944 length:192 start_codon:yes stop_codon:yes gene_type:complete